MGATRHETRALLRAHLSAAAGSGHLTRHCAVCRRLQRLAIQMPPEGPQTAGQEPCRPARHRAAEG
jgi:Family of unknown function (DUF6274)